jgi:N-acetylglucosamine kinase-like BadF-type ATPase
MESKKYILGIDGGGTKTETVVFNDMGETLIKYEDMGTNLYVFKDNAVKLIISIIDRIVEDLKINYSDISALGCSVAGVSDLNSRDLLLKEFDKLKIINNSIVLSDTESAYQLLCPTGQGILVSVGTGVVCLGRNSNGESFKVAGKGFDNGDSGSGYWIGKEIIKKLFLNQGILLVDPEMKQIYNYIREKLNVDNLDSLENLLHNQSDIVTKTASLAEKIINFAEDGNDIALSVIQEGTRNVAEYIIYLINEMNFNSEKVVISGNGSVIKNDYYRKSLNDALQFDILDLNWIFSDISCSYSSGIIAAQCNDINLSINDIIKHIN